MDTGSVSTALSNRMNYLVARQGVISGNIANADTPGYLEQDITFAPSNSPFAGKLAQVRTDAAHMAGGEAGNGIGDGTKNPYYMQHNGNAVRLDVEMEKLNQTGLDYRMMTELYAKQVSMQQLALGSR